MIALRQRLGGEVAAYALLLAVALALRLVDLGARPFHHDESQDAYFSWVFFSNGDYHYNPLLHGPLRFYLTSLMYLLFGASDFSARLAPALMGTVIVALAFLLRKQIGRVAAFAVAVLLAVDPSFLYYSRFAREDIYVACLTLGLAIVVLRFLDTPRRHHPALIGALLAASFATKESTFITVAVGGSFLAGLLAAQIVRARRRGRPWRSAPLVRSIAGLGGEAWGWGLAAFAGVFTVLFTVFLTVPSGLGDGVFDGLTYWLGQQPVGRGGEPVYFYGLLLVAEEWPVLLLGAIGIALAITRPTVTRAFLLWYFVASLAVYSWAGEKFAWLILHPLLPLVLLAGLGVQEIWRARRPWLRRLGLAAVAVCAASTGLAAWSANVRYEDNPKELLVSTQSAHSIIGVRDEVRAFAARRRAAGKPVSITVDGASGATFPWAWYFRDLPVAYPDLTKEPTLPPSQLLILTDASRARFGARLARYHEQRFDFRVWWLRDYTKMSPRSLARWIVTRQPWSGLGGMTAWLYSRRSGAAAR